MDRQRHPVITVDGPSGSGKTTLGRALASTLMLPLIDTGLFYRAVVVGLVKRGIRRCDPGLAIQLGQESIFQINTDPKAKDDSWQVRLNGEEAGALLRDPQYATMLSEVSAVPEVRAALLPRQRELARGGAVAVGRDCGTVVFPDAAVKFYLLAGEEVRMQRRAAQLEAMGVSSSSGDVSRDILARDQLDSQRKVAPMRAADDAVLLNSEELSIEAMVDEALSICAGRGIMP